MLNKYFKVQKQTEKFIKNNENIISELKNKNVIVCSDADSFLELNKEYKYNEKFNIIAFVEYGHKKTNAIRKLGIKTTAPEDIKKGSYDYILITSTDSFRVKEHILNMLDEDESKTKQLFFENFCDENLNMEFLIKQNFEKTLPELVAKLKGKKVLFYGGGQFFRLINERFNLSEINAIGIIDKVLSIREGISEICGYKLYGPESIKELQPDYVVVTTKRLLDVYEDLYFNYLKGTKIKITPLVKRDFLSIIKEIR